MCFGLVIIRRLERTHKKKNLDNSSSASSKTTFADAMKHMGLRLPSKDEGPCLHDITGIRVAYVWLRILISCINLRCYSSPPSVCEVTNKALQDNLLGDNYDTLPPLKYVLLLSSVGNKSLMSLIRAGSLISWSDLEGDGQIVPSAWGEQCPNLDFKWIIRNDYFIGCLHLST